MWLHAYLRESAGRFPDHVAITEPHTGRSISYRELDALSDRVCARLLELPARPGDRIGLCLPKSIDAIACMFGALRAGMAYVPVDPEAPTSRNAFILNDCAVRAAIVDSRQVGSLRDALGGIEAKPEIIAVDMQAGGLIKALGRIGGDAVGTKAPEAYENRLAFILYTSGSTGKPKGVMISHENASSFVEWCDAVFEPSPEDRFSSHAPFHFDLSVLDIFLAIRSGGTLVLISPDVGKEPVGLARLISTARISVWYSAPSILGLMAQYGRLEDHDYSHLRLVLFAGEVFPIRRLRSLKEQLSEPRYFNLYGPTETNVCTFFEVPAAIPPDRDRPFPIGKVCAHLSGIVVDTEGLVVNRGHEGELCIAGPSVMQGYWSRPELTDASILDTDDGRRWYRTGDLVVEDGVGDLEFVGRRDRMVKRRGYRIELGEIESCLHRHEDVIEAAVVAWDDGEAQVRITAHLATGDGGRLSLIRLKSFCTEHLPIYMIPDGFQFHRRLPRTSTDKVDYQALMQTG